MVFFVFFGFWVGFFFFFASQVECKVSKAPSIYCSTTPIQDVKKNHKMYMFSSELYMFMCS